MNILLTGATGFIGTYLARLLLERNHTVIGTARSAEKNRISHPRYRFISADTTRPGDWLKRLESVDAVVNLAGRSIFGRWTDAIKAEIRESRIETTRQVAAGLPPGKPTIFISTSAVGYYGSRGEEVLTEESPAGEDFLARLAQDWEAAALKAQSKGARVVVMRLGVVLGPDGGAIAQMVPAFKSFLGGPLAGGRQWFPWVHIEDLAAAVLFMIEKPAIQGPVNLCAPQPVRNAELARALGAALHRPAWVTTPAFMLRMALGEFAEVLLASQRAVPQKLLAHGFSFKYNQIDQAIAAVVHDDNS